MKKSILILGTLFTIVILFGCKKITLDGLAFPSEKTDSYQFEAFEEGEIEVPAQYNLTAADRTLIEFNSTDQETGEEFKLYGVYIGDMATISTDTVILYLHGQSKHMDHYWSRAALLANVGGSLNYGVFMIDYRGYGMSEGTSTEQGLYEDADAAIDWLISQGATQEKTIFYGFSLGAIPSIDRAAYRTDFKPSKLIIESPLASVQNLVDNSTLMNVNADFVTDLGFENSEKIKEVTCTLLWMHGREDDYIDIQNGELIYANYTGTDKTAYRVDDCGHSEVPGKMGYETYVSNLLSYIRN
jgi:pimeloyl-ACP methyl ester carboxylesterase